mgnify:CR=1 FL=1
MSKGFHSINDEQVLEFMEKNKKLSPPPSIFGIQPN